MSLLATDSLNQVFGTISPPPQISKYTQNGATGAQGLGLFFTNIISIIYVFAGLVFIFMIIIGAFQWVVSGGDKEAIAAARKRITSAIIGIVLLALAGIILTVLGKILGFQFFAAAPG